MPDDSSFFTIAKPVEAKSPPPIIEGEPVENVSYSDPAPPWSGRGFKSKARQEWELRNPDWRDTHPVGQGDAKPGSRPAASQFKGSNSGGRGERPKIKGDPILAQMLELGHVWLAVATEQPKLAIDGEEAQILADALAGLAAHYQVTFLQETKGPWAQFAKALGVVYAPRMVEIIMENMKRERSNPKPSPSAKTNGGNPKANGSVNPSGVNPNDATLFDPTIYAGMA